MPFWKSLKGDHPSYIGGSTIDSSAAASSAKPPPPYSSSGGGNSDAKQTHAQGKEEPNAGGSGPSGSSWLAATPPPYHNWQSVVPDTALLPPPPAITNKLSPTGNAQEEDARRAHHWCEQYPLLVPHDPLPDQVRAVQAGHIALQRPREYSGTLTSSAPGCWRGSTRSGARDCILISSLPLYFEHEHSPFRTERPKTIYFEMKLLSIGGRRSASNDENALAIGYCAVPYPTWRMPGWERGSLAVHSDDGRRYVNDTDGGVDFIAPFRAGETIGLGVRFSIPDGRPDFAPTSTSGQPLKGQVFFTRNGVKAGEWDIQEAMDAEIELGAFGVDGKYDLYAAVGVFGQMDFEVMFEPRRWLWNP